MNKYFVPEHTIDRMAIEEAAKVHGTIIIPDSVDPKVVEAKAKNLGLYDQIENIEYWYRTYTSGPRIYLYADKVFEEMLAWHNIDSMFMVSD